MLIYSHVDLCDEGTGTCITGDSGKDTDDSNDSEGTDVEL